MVTTDQSATLASYLNTRKGHTRPIQPALPGTQPSTRIPVSYRKLHSCETSLVKLVNDILWNMEKQLVTAIVIPDLSAAFDMVDHDQLLEVLETRYGIVGAAKQWYKSYLQPRRFRVAIENTQSKPRQLEYSVPQGSIQGAFLFVTYASTLEDVVDTTKLELNGFADDHILRRAFKPSKLDQQHKNKIPLQS